MPGFSDGLVHVLVTWRREVESSFRPSTTNIPRHKLDALDARFGGAMGSIERSARTRAAELAQLIERLKGEHPQAQVMRDDLARGTAQAFADLARFGMARFAATARHVLVLTACVLTLLIFRRGPAGVAV